MTAITFDTLKYVKTLRAAGFNETQAEVLAEAHINANEKSLDGLVTDAKLDRKLALVRTDLAVIKWMLGILVTGVLALILKSFFLH
ncbi:MAG: DUF1640 domain-containing protein [Magnetococcales bacterium]|nr:DUF1640 domain-containing protein [Magnetococcales bacterium]